MAKFKHQKRIAKFFKTKLEKQKLELFINQNVETVTQKLKFNFKDLTRKTLNVAAT